MKGELSVIIPTHNAAEFLASLLPKLHGNEVIVVDDGSTDETEMVAREFELTYLKQTNQGPSAARNRGLRHSASTFVAFLDVDDEWTSSHPAVALEAMRANAIDVVIGKTQCLTNGSEPFEKPFHTFNIGSALFRRDVFIRVGSFDESLRFGEDLDWFLRAREKGVRMALLDRTTLNYRLHEKNMIAQAGAARGGMLNALHLSIERRRGSDSVLADLPHLA